MASSSIRSKFSYTLAVLLFVSTAAASWVQSGERAVTFRAVGPGGLRIEGQGQDVTLTEDGDFIVASVGLGSIKTGIELRDRHMKEKYLETAKHPKAVFTVEKAKVRSPGEGYLDGQLQLHGVTKTIRLNYKSTGTENDCTISGSTRINMKSFNIEVPSYLGVTVQPEVDVSFKVGARNK